MQGFTYTTRLQKIVNQEYLLNSIYKKTSKRKRRMNEQERSISGRISSHPEFKSTSKNGDKRNTGIFDPFAFGRYGEIDPEACAGNRATVIELEGNDSIVKFKSPADRAMFTFLMQNLMEESQQIDEQGNHVKKLRAWL